MIDNKDRLVVLSDVLAIKNTDKRKREDAMSDTTDKKIYSPQIVGLKRQMTIPAQMMKQLGLRPGDFIQFTVSGRRIVEARPVRPIPIDHLPDDMRKMLEDGTLEFSEGQFQKHDNLDTLEAEVEKRAATVRRSRRSDMP
jgi:antitoxin component of MazEF toxin-antitoxin module